jgi:hypothetical protein
MTYLSQAGPCRRLYVSAVYRTVEPKRLAGRFHIREVFETRPGDFLRPFVARGLMYQESESSTASRALK